MSKIWERVQLSRSIERATANDYIANLFTNFVELKGDLVNSEDPAVIAGFAKLNGKSVVVIGQEKGKDVDSKVHHNFGMANPAGYRKAIRAAKLAEKFNFPIVLLPDTPGAYPGETAEIEGQGYIISECMKVFMKIPVPTVSIFIGEGGSGGAIALGVANKVLMLENATYSILSPEGFASILWKDASRAPEAADILKPDAASLKKQGIIDQIIAEENFAKTIEELKTEIELEFTRLAALGGKEIRKERELKYLSLSRR